MIRKLETAESTIENLNAQLSELECNESLVRARQQHENIIHGLQQKHSEEMLNMKEVIDEQKRLNEEKVRLILYNSTVLLLH